jgi:hypothetical protein
MQEMNDRALALWRETHSLDVTLFRMRLEGYSPEELRTVERWVKERWLKEIPN